MREGGTARGQRQRSRHPGAVGVTRVASVEERVDVGLGIERDQVVDFFAGADEANRQIQFAGNGYHDAALGGSVEFGEHDARDSRMAPEFAGLIQAILSGGRVEYQQHIVRRAGNYLGCGALHFFQLGHEIGFGVQATGGVHDHDIGVTRARGGERVENHGGGSAPDFCLIISTPERRAQISSCSMAAARNVSAAQRTTLSLLSSSDS